MSHQQELRLRYRLRKEDLRNGQVDLERLQRRIEEIVKTIISRHREILGEWGELVLDWARRNAEFYYAQGGAQYTGNKPQPFKPRHPATEELYERSPYHQSMAGLSTGQNKLIDSLLMSGMDNIFRVSGDTVTIGTENHLARLLEEGGPRPPKRHVGQGPKQMYLKPGPSGEIETPEQILAEYGADFMIPPRPFLKPALWHLRDRDSGKILYDIMIEHIREALAVAVPEVEVLVS